MTHHRLTLYIILMACLMLMRGKPGFAQNTVSDAWQKNIPSDAAAIKEAAKVLIEQRDYQGAVAKLEQSLAFKKDYYLAVYNLAVAYALRGTELQAPSASDRTRAWRELDKARTIAKAQGIKDAALYITMGWLASMEAIFSQPEEFARRTAWYDTAQRYWESALKIDVASTDALNNLGALYELRGDFERALEYYGKAKALKDAQGEANHRRLQLLTIRLTSPVASAETRDRRALLIGNGAYADAGLSNPVNDARDMADTLRHVGFEVTLLLNTNQSAMEQAVEAFTQGVPRGTVGLFFFAGHGVQIDDRNYLIPIGARLQIPVDVKSHAIAADWILSRMDEAGMELKLFILDACRDNPFSRHWLRTRTRGLAPMQAPSGSLIAHATVPGRTASDGMGRNSPYTTYLLREIPVPGRSMEIVFKAVRRGVIEATRGEQTPWESSSLTTDFSFARSTLAESQLPSGPSGTQGAVGVYPQQPEVPKTYRNSLSMEFVPISAGTFQMGANDSDAYDDEKPVHTVRITQPFYLGKYEVTQGQWQAVMGNNPSHFKDDPNRPVESVSWDDVQEFIRRLNAREGGSIYRLPTEAEWEYAARAGTTSSWSFGDDVSKLSLYAWCDGKTRGQTHPVGQLRPNPWGLYDIHGNVWELVQDWYGGYPSSTAVDPAGPPSGLHRVRRGGSWYGIARECWSSARFHLTPPSDRTNDTGFRLLRMAQ